MSFKDRHALETLPARIAALHEDIARLGSILADPALYKRDPQKFTATTEALTKAQSKLETAEEQWLTLELQRESLETS